ncbi:MAG: glycosyltransferase [Succinivibrionaceae bacterium]
MFGIFKSKKTYNFSKGFGYAEAKIRKSTKNKTVLADKLRILAKESFESYPLDALRVMSESNELVPQNTKVKWIGFKMYDLGEVRSGYEKLISLPKEAFVSESEHKKFNKIVEEFNYLELIEANINNTTVEEVKVETKSEVLNMMSYKTQDEWMKAAKKQILNFRTSKFQKFSKPSSKRIGIICDEPFLQYVKPAADFVYLTPDNYESVINCTNEEQDKIQKPLDMLMVVSTWLGIDSVWRGVSFIPKSENAYGYERTIALNCISLCKKNQIPVVFYNTEDSSHLEKFIEFASIADYVYTADASTVTTLNDICTDAKLVEYLPLGVNPLIHNPVGMRYTVEPNSVVYSGVWFAEKENKVKELTKIFNSVIATKLPLHIIDGAYGITDKKYNFPESFKKYIAGGAEYDDIVKICKTAPWSVVYNSVENNSRLVNSRSFELVASGCNILSNYNEELVNVLPSSFLVNRNTDIADFVKRTKPENLYERQLYGIRATMNNHTCFNRINHILVNAGIEDETQLPTILVIGDNTQHNEESFNRQTYEGKTFVDKDNLTVEMFSCHDAITWFDDNIYYGEFYLEDMMNAFRYTDADFVTKDCYYVQETKNKLTFSIGTEHDYVDEFKEKESTVFWRTSFDIRALLELGNEDKAYGINDIALSYKVLKGYSIDRANFIRNYETYVLANIRPSYLQYRTSVIIPIFNNGTYLLNYAFSSLLNSSSFKDMEIILVDDGSTEQNTISIINYLSKRYKNVRSFFFNDGGSGSASRPRNKGIELATGEYILFFDPDDQCAGDGYAKLIQATDDEDFDLVIGNNYVLGKERAETNNYKYLYDVYKSSDLILEEGIKESAIEFRTVRIQSMLIFTEFLKNSGITFKEGTIGEDTLFSWQILKLAKSVKLSNNFTHTYFSARENSATNTFTVDMFRKLSSIQQDKVKWLQDNDELEPYMEHKFETYAKNTILGRFEKVAEEDKDECELIVKEILSVFKPFYKGEDEVLMNFMGITKVQSQKIDPEIEIKPQSEQEISQKQVEKTPTLSRRKRRR